MLDFFKHFIKNTSLFIRIIKIIILLLIVGIIAVIYVVYSYNKELPSYKKLSIYYPPSITRIYSADGKLIEEYSKEYRIFIPIENIPKKLANAFIAAEDQNFYEHSGVDVQAIIRAVVANVTKFGKRKRLEGGSTITQQVVKNFLLSPERSIDRKIKEAILAYKISHAFSKEKILELYLNQIYLGKGAYGVAAAALKYFNKSIEELTLNEIAVLASLPKAPSKFNPEKDYEKAFHRKNYVINRMVEDEYISDIEAKEALSQPIILATHNDDDTNIVDAPYYASEVRKEVINMFGEEYFYNSGLTIITNLDSTIHEAAVDALYYGINRYDKKRGFRQAITNMGRASKNNYKELLNSIASPNSIKDNKLAIILEANDNVADIAIKHSRNKFTFGKIFLSDLKWTRTNLRSIKQILKNGDVIIVSKIDSNKYNNYSKITPAKNQYFLSQIPNVNGAIIVIENNSGRVQAAIGGYDFYQSKFNRVTQARRQLGSAIKPFVYLSAIEQGARNNDIFVDEPIELYQGAGLPMWEPRNFERNFMGPMTLRMALEKSRNIPTIKVGQYTGLTNVAEIIRRYGINEKPRMIQSLVLGTTETTLDKISVAYSSLASNGYKIMPHYIELIKDRKGNIIYKRDYSDCTSWCKNLIPSSEMIKSPYKKNVERGMEKLTDSASNYQLLSILIGATKRGTSRSSRILNKTLAGKTGTTNDSKDVWFVGITPYVTVGTYLGFDYPMPMGNRISGGTTALPVFIKFMKNAYDDRESIDFIIPESKVKFETISYKTGIPTNIKEVEEGDFAIQEVFKRSQHSAPNFFFEEMINDDEYLNNQKQENEYNRGGDVNIDDNLEGINFDSDFNLDDDVKQNDDSDSHDDQDQYQDHDLDDNDPFSRVMNEY